MNILTYEHMNNCSYEQKYQMFHFQKEASMSDNLKQIVAVNNEIILKVRENFPEEEILYDLADLFKVFGDSTRIRILYALMESELCVSDLSSLLNLNQSAVSHQLRILKDAKLVKFRREGKVIVSVFIL